MPRGRNTAKEIKRAVDNCEALSMRLKGYSYAKIASVLGVSYATAYDMVARELEKRRTESAEKLEQVRELEVARLDEYVEKLQPRIDEGDSKAIEAAIKIQARRARILGLDTAVVFDGKIESVDDATLLAKLQESLGGRSITGTGSSSGMG